jgi:hypothetical protein
MSSYVVDALETSGEVTIANLHRLTVSMASMHRLLGRLDAAGKPIQANAELIRQAIEATRAESQQVDRLLKSLVQDKRGVEGAAVIALSRELITINSLLNALEGAIRQVGG